MTSIRACDDFTYGWVMIFRRISDFSTKRVGVCSAYKTNLPVKYISTELLTYTAWSCLLGHCQVAWRHTWTYAGWRRRGELDTDINQRGEGKLGGAGSGLQRQMRHWRSRMCREIRREGSCWSFLVLHWENTQKATCSYLHLPTTQWAPRILYL